MDITLPNIPEIIDAAFQADRRRGIARSLHASSINHPCERHLVYCQTVDVEQPISLELARRFAVGRLFHEQFVLDLRQALRGRDTDVEVVQEEHVIHQNPYGIGGRIDLALRWGERQNRQSAPVEFKSCDPMLFKTINSLADVMNHRSYFVRMWPGQILCYLLIEEKPVGIICLRNKSSGEYRQIPISLDYEMGEKILARAERVKSHVAEGTLPDRADYGPWCEKCPYREACLPDISLAPGVDMQIDNDTLDRLCAVREANAEARKLYEAADEAIKEYIRHATDGRDVSRRLTTVTRNFEITASGTTRTAYDIPDNIKAQYARKEPQWRKKIKLTGAIDGVDTGSIPGTEEETEGEGA